jgi:hypothetical protein
MLVTATKKTQFLPMDMHLLNGAAVHWASKKKDQIAKSTAKAEYVAASFATDEALWLPQSASNLLQVTGRLFTTKANDYAHI